VGIETDPAVVFADGFEDDAQASDLGRKWDAVYQNQDIRIATETQNVYRGTKALEFTVPQMIAELSNATDKVLSQERDVLFLRYYSKFQPPFDVVGSSHNGSSISAHYFINGQATPGVPADGTNKFLANLENWRGDVATTSPGPLNIYLYHPSSAASGAITSFPRARSSRTPASPTRSAPSSRADPTSLPRSIAGIATNTWSRRTPPASATVASRSGSTESSWRTSRTSDCVTSTP
jgi:hypothetical protein